MAIPYGISLQLRDNPGKRAKTEFFVPTTFTIAQYTEAAQDLADTVDAISGAVIEKSVLNIPVDMSALINNTVGSLSDVGDLGQFAFNTAENRPVRVNVPGLIETLVPSGSDDIDQANVDVAAYLTAMLTGILVTGAVTVQPCNIGEGDLTSTKFARERFKNRGAR